MQAQDVRRRAWVQNRLVRPTRFSACMWWGCEAGDDPCGKVLPFHNSNNVECPGHPFVNKRLGLTDMSKGGLRCSTRWPPAQRSPRNNRRSTWSFSLLLFANNVPLFSFDMRDNKHTAVISEAGRAPTWSSLGSLSKHGCYTVPCAVVILVVLVVLVTSGAENVVHE